LFIFSSLLSIFFSSSNINESPNIDFITSASGK
jgi:hypothetical protein